MDGRKTIAALPKFIGLIDIHFFIHVVPRRGFDARSSVKKVQHNEGKRNELRIPSLVFRWPDFNSWLPTQILSLVQYPGSPGNLIADVSRYYSLSVAASTRQTIAQAKSVSWIFVLSTDLNQVS